MFPLNLQMMKATYAGDDDLIEDLVEDSVLYVSEHKYKEGCLNNWKRQIRKKTKKCVLKYELFYNPGKDKPVCSSNFL